MSILSELEELVRSAERTKNREQQMLDMFKLAGYQMNINPDDIEGPNAPRDLMDLLKDALGNPPEDAGKWIRVSDIPRFIKENLTIPEDLKSWSDDVLTEAKPQVMRSSKPVEAKDIPDGYNLAGDEQFNSESETEPGKYYADITGAIWYRESDRAWSLEGDSDKGGYYGVDAFNFGPLVPVNKTKRSAVL